MSNRENLMRELSGAQFAALEMQLFLDTHKNNEKALKSLQEYVAKMLELKKEYEKNYGPLTAKDVYGDTRYEWLNAPWPWENESEAKK